MKIVRLGLGILNWLSLFFALGIFANSLIALSQGNIFLSRTEGNHSLIYVTLFIVFVFFTIRYNKYRFLMSAISVAFMVYLHEFLWFIFSIIHVGFVQNSDYWFYWWMYGILVNFDILLILSFLVKIDKEKISFFLMFYYLVWLFMLFYTMWVYHVPYVFSVDNYASDKFQFYYNVDVNALEICEWGLYIVLFLILEPISYNNVLVLSKNRE
jgi:hypothetical protein